MDPAPQAHPILYYVLSRIPTLSKPPKPTAPEFDIKQPLPPPRAPPTAVEFELVELMPGLRRPPVLRAMGQALGPRPDHELADSSRAVVAAAGGSRVDIEACHAVVARLEEAHDASVAPLHA